VDLTTLSDDALPCSRVAKIERRPGTSWLIDSLWLENAAGIIGGQPKCCKSWLGLDMAVSVASGTPCLGKFPVTTPGPTLVYLAEDAIEEVRSRVESICKHRALSIEPLDLVVITAPILRLDDESDRKRLWSTVERLRPRLLLLDPLVRLHRLDENNARDIAGLLGFLREIQRKANCAVVLTHHASKRSCSRPGQGLRGTSDLHAFGDSNLYLSRHDDLIELATEHRSAAALPPLLLRLTGEDGATHLGIVDNAKVTTPVSLESRIVEMLTNAQTTIPRTELREKLRTNNQRFGRALANLIASGRIVASPDGISPA
jgi:hypothetical protein